MHPFYVMLPNTVRDVSEASLAGFEPARQRYLVSQKPSTLPTELSGRLKMVIYMCIAPGQGQKIPYLGTVSINSNCSGWLFVKKRGLDRYVKGVATPGPWVIKLFSCSTQLKKKMKFNLLTKC